MLPNKYISCLLATTVWTQDVKWTDVLWTSYVRPIYVLCPEGIYETHKSIVLVYFQFFALPHWFLILKIHSDVHICWSKVLNVHNWPISKSVHFEDHLLQFVEIITFWWKSINFNTDASCTSEKNQMA